MTLAEYFLVVTSCLYMGAAVNYLRLNQSGLALAFTCYALANVGLIIAAIQGR